MLDMPIRAGRRLQDMVNRVQETWDRKTEPRQQQADLRRSRMSCSDSLRSFPQNQDWTGGMGVSPSGRFQVVEQPQTRRRIFSREGIRWDAACAMLIVFGALLLVILLMDLAGIGISSRSISILNEKIEGISARNEQIIGQLSASSSDISVLTEAVKYNLVASGGVRTIRLTAPMEANLTLSTSPTAVQEPPPTDEPVLIAKGD